MSKTSVLLLLVVVALATSADAETFIDGRTIVEFPFTSMKQYVQAQLKATFGCNFKLQAKWYEGGVLQEWSGYCQNMESGLPKSPWHAKGPAVNQDSVMDYMVAATEPYQGPVSYTLVGSKELSALDSTFVTMTDSVVTDTDDSFRQMGSLRTVQTITEAKQTSKYSAGVSMTISLTPPLIPEGLLSVDLTTKYDWSVSDTKTHSEVNSFELDDYATFTYDRKVCALATGNTTFTSDTYQWNTHVVFNGFYGRQFNDVEYGMWYLIDQSPDKVFAATLTGTVDGVPVAHGESLAREYNMGTAGCNYTDPLTFDELN